MPVVDDVVTVGYKRLVNGNIPLEPYIQRVRKDRTTDDVIEQANPNAFSLKSMTSLLFVILYLIFSLLEHFDYSSRWSGTVPEMRGFFINYAKRAGFDYTNAAEWYKVKKQEIFKIKVPPLLSIT